MRLPTQPLVSVVIPTYNRERTLRRAVESVFRQTCQDFEIIVVDDGSADGTLQLLRSFPDQRVRILQHPTNRGAAAARNRGIAAAKGTYVAFLDSDDEWLPEKLAVQVEDLATTPDSLGASCTGYFLHLLDHGLELEHSPANRVCDPDHLLQYGCDLGPGATLVVRRDCFDAVGHFDEGLVQFEDWDWLLRFTRHFQLGFLARPLSRIFVAEHRDAQVIETSTNRFLELNRAALLQLSSFQRRKVIGRLHLLVAQAYLRQRQIGAGIRHTLKATFWNPVQRIGMYLMLFDSLCRTSFAVRGSLWKKRLIGNLRGDRAPVAARCEDVGPLA
jgi:glycosyltransferase involved in cell wall biosynthesis